MTIPKRRQIAVFDTNILHYCIFKNPSPGVSKPSKAELAKFHRNREDTILYVDLMMESAFALPPTVTSELKRQVGSAPDGEVDCETYERLCGRDSFNCKIPATGDGGVRNKLKDVRRMCLEINRSGKGEDLDAVRKWREAKGRKEDDEYRIDQTADGRILAYSSVLQEMNRGADVILVTYDKDFLPFAAKWITPCLKVKVKQPCDAYWDSISSVPLPRTCDYLAKLTYTTVAFWRPLDGGGMEFFASPNETCAVFCDDRFEIKIGRFAEKLLTVAQVVDEAKKKHP